MGQQYLKPPGRCQPGWVDAGLDRLAALLPARCVVCGQRADWRAGDGALCRPCLAGLPTNAGACSGCGLPSAEPFSGSRCPDCHFQPPPWQCCHAPLRYDFPVDRLVLQLKFGRDLAAGRALAAAMARAGPPPAPRDAVLVPVPLHRLRQWRRGYNQAAEIAGHLCRATGWPVNAGALKRVRRTRAQSGLHARQRRHNLEGAFSWRSRQPPPPVVILVDDVMTTGSTLGACTAALRRAGARRVLLWVAARSVRQ